MIIRFNDDSIQHKVVMLSIFIPTNTARCPASTRYRFKVDTTLSGLVVKTLKQRRVFAGCYFILFKIFLEKLELQTLFNGHKKLLISGVPT